MMMMGKKNKEFYVVLYSFIRSLYNEEVGSINPPRFFLSPTQILLVGNSFTQSTKVLCGNTFCMHIYGMGQYKNHHISPTNTDTTRPDVVISSLTHGGQAKLLPIHLPAHSIDRHVSTGSTFS
jgi:hypothetical protein